MWKRILPLLVEHHPEVSVALQLRLHGARSAPRHRQIQRVTHIEDARLGPLVPVLEWITKKRMELFRPDLFQAMSFTLAPVRGCVSVQCVYDCIHEAFPAVTGNQAFSLQKRAAIEAADHIVAISHATKEDVTEFFGVPPERISVVHLAADPFFHEAETPEQAADRTAWLERFGLRRPFFLYVGIRGHYKNFFTLLHAYAASGLARTHDLVALGGEPNIRSPEKEFVIKNRLERSVRLLPKLDDTALRHLYRSAAAFCYPSLKEGFGIPVLEAMASGCPVIASRIKVFQEIGVPPGLMHEPADTEELAELLRAVAGWTSAKRAEYARHAKELAARYSWEQAAESLYQIYGGLLRGSGRRKGKRRSEQTAAIERA